MEHNLCKNEKRNIPRVTVIMGVYNAEKTLKRAVESVLAQTFTSWKMIICDDGSTDDSFELA